MLLLALIVLALVCAALAPMTRRRRMRPSPEAGRAGERRVRLIVERHGLEALHDVYLRTGSGATQVDHLVRVGRTIYVIETKNFSGTCFGRAGERAWTHVGRNGARRRFYNPLLQNAGHGTAVRRIAGGWCRIRTLVVFTGSASFPKGAPDDVVGIDALDVILKQEAARRSTSLIGWLAWARLRRAAETEATAGGAHRRSLARARAG